ncbi:MAG TPA: heme peroxidase family protein [Ktedonobacterales bacterium]
MISPLASAPVAGTHSCVLAPHLKHELSSGADGKYGRMFPDLPAHNADEAALMALGRSGAMMDMAAHPAADATSDNPRIPAGFAIFGQFIAHDITADRSLLHHHTTLSQIRNMRTPRLDLECLYGAGPTGNPYLYDVTDADKLLIGRNDLGQPLDLPRNQQGIALLGDPRNDVHQPISQLHLAFLKFHNAVVDHLRGEGVAAAEVFTEAQRVVRWHYQWTVIHEFLPLSVGESLVEEILREGPRFYTFDERPFIPVEFSDAAYRFGHSQIRSSYALNDHATGRMFPECAGACPVPHQHVIDWRYFFQVDASVAPQASTRIDARLAHSLIELPEAIVGTTEIPEYHSLAVRDLLRARSLDLPSGEAVAAAMGVAPLGEDEVGLRALGWQGETPLWYYVLKESAVRHHGERLGAVGGRIVAEVLVALIDADPASYRAVAPGWQPTLLAARPGSFTVADMLRFAGAV